MGLGFGQGVLAGGSCFPATTLFLLGAAQMRRRPMGRWHLCHDPLLLGVLFLLRLPAPPTVPKRVDGPDQSQRMEAGGHRQRRRWWHVGRCLPVGRLSSCHRRRSCGRCHHEGHRQQQEAERCSGGDTMNAHTGSFAKHHEWSVKIHVAAG